MVPVVTLVALYLTFQGGQAIVNLPLLGYAFVTQLFPSMTMSLLCRLAAPRPSGRAGHPHRHPHRQSRRRSDCRHSFAQRPPGTLPARCDVPARSTKE